MCFPFLICGASLDTWGSGSTCCWVWVGDLADGLRFLSVVACHASFLFDDSKESSRGEECDGLWLTLISLFQILNDYWLNKNWSCVLLPTLPGPLRDLLRYWCYLIDNIWGTELSTRTSGIGTPVTVINMSCDTPLVSLVL